VGKLLFPDPLVLVDDLGTFRFIRDSWLFSLLIDLTPTLPSSFIHQLIMRFGSTRIGDFLPTLSSP